MNQSGDEESRGQSRFASCQKMWCLFRVTQIVVSELYEQDIGDCCVSSQDKLTGAPEGWQTFRALYIANFLTLDLLHDALKLRIGAPWRAERFDA